MRADISSVQVVPRIITESSGPSHSVPNLCRALTRQNVQVELHLLEPTVLSADQEYTVSKWRAQRYPGAFRLGHSPAMMAGLRTAALKADLVHGHSLWMLPNIYASRAARFAGKKFVLSPRGTLSEWALKRSSFLKGCVGRMGQYRAIFSADMIHATSDQELAEVRSFGYQGPVCVVPNGVAVPDADCRPAGSEFRSRKPSLVYLSRIHPKKGLDLLLEVWPSLRQRFPDWELNIAGPLDSAYAMELKAKAEQGGAEGVSFLGEVLGREKLELLGGASVFVLPSYSENFGIAVAEALANAVPVVVSDKTPWGGVISKACGRVAATNASSLEGALIELMALSDADRAVMGQRGRQWMLDEFAWDAVGGKMRDAYNWLCRSAELPEFVVLD